MFSFNATLVLALATQIVAATTGQIQKWYEAGRHEQVVQAAVQDQDPLLVYLAGSSLEKLARLEEARQMYGKLVGRGETDPWALVGRAAAELVTGSGTPSADALTRAAQSVDRAIDVAPGLAAAHFQRGLIEGHKRDYAGAAAAFEQAMRLDPAFAYAHYYAGLSYSRIERPDQMAIHFERFLSLAPEAPEAGQVQSLMRSVRGRR